MIRKLISNIVVISSIIIIFSITVSIMNDVNYVIDNYEEFNIDYNIIQNSKQLFERIYGISGNRYQSVIIDDIYDGTSDVTDEINRDVSWISSEYAYNPKTGVILYAQGGDARWSNTKMRKDAIQTINSSGCGFCSSAMVVSTLKQEIITPDVLVNTKVQGNKTFGDLYYFIGQGASSALYKAVADYYELSYTLVSGWKPEVIIDALSKGYLIITGQTIGIFTKGAHMIVLSGVADKDKMTVYVNDPNGNGSVSHKASYDIILTGDTYDRMRQFSSTEFSLVSPGLHNKKGEYGDFDQSGSVNLYIIGNKDEPYIAPEEEQ